MSTSIVAAKGKGPPAHLLECLRRYRIGRLVGVTALEGGFAGRTWLVRTPSSALVVKRFHPRFTAARVRTAACAQHHVASHSGLAPSVLPTEAGDLVAPTAGGLWAISEYMAGSHIGPDSLQAHDFTLLGRSLAILHRSLDHFQPSDPVDGFLAFPHAPGKELARLAEAKADDPAIAADLQKRLAVLERLEDETFHRLPLSWVHGDVRPDNIVSSPTSRQPIAFIDFDQVSRFPQVYEVMRAFVYSLTTTQPAEVIRDKFRRYLTAYLTHTSVDPDSWRRLVDFYLWVLAADARCYTDTQHPIRNIHEFAKKRLTTLEWAWSLRHTLQRTVDHLLGLGASR